MKQIFLYEFVTGGGFFHLEGKPRPEGSLLREGQAMWSAFYEDLSRMSDVRPISMRDWRLESAVEFSGDFVDERLPEQQTFTRLAKSSDATMLIAPEFDLHLHHRAYQLEMAGCRSLSPSSRFIRIAGDKSATSKALRARGVRVPEGILLRPDEALPADFRYPAILKPNDGAGSLSVRLVEVHLADPQRETPMRLEEKVDGTHCSVSFLCRGGRKSIPFPPMEQLISNDGTFQYLGGRRLMDAQLAARATRLGASALAALPTTVGYVGIDIVLGNQADGSRDAVIEVNPRLTTSYIGLRKIATTNLAKAMVDVSFGRALTVEFSDRPVEFLADGTIR